MSKTKNLVARTSHKCTSLGRQTLHAEIKVWRATSTLPLSHWDTMRNKHGGMRMVQQGRSNSEYPLIRTCISHQEYSQAMPSDHSRKIFCRRDPCTIRAPRSTGTPSNGDAIVRGGTRKLRVALSSRSPDRLSWKPAPDQVWLRA